MTVIHVFKDVSQNRNYLVEEEEIGNLIVLRISYKASSFKYFFSGRSLWKGIKRAKRQHGAINKLFLNVFYPLGTHLWWIKSLLKAPIYAIEHWTGYHQNTPKYQPNHLHLKVAQYFSKYCKSVLGVSEDLCQAMRRQEVKNVKGVVYNVVDEALFHVSSEPKAIKFTFLHISSLKEEHKNFSLLLKSFAVASQNIDVRLIVINSGDEIPYLPLIKELGITSKIEFTGKKSSKEVAQVMQGCNAFVLSSNYENMPCVISEALCCGLPIISTNVGGIAEIIHAQNGILVEKGNAVQLTKALVEVVQHIENYNGISISEEGVSKFGKLAVLEQLEMALEL